MKQKWLAKFFGCVAALAAVLLILIGLGALWLAYRSPGVRLHRIAQELEGEKVAAERLGLPLEPDDLRTKPPIPDAQNAAPLYVKLDQLRKTRTKSVQDADGAIASAILKTGRSSEDNRKACDLISKRSGELRIAEEAAARQRCDFRRPWNQGPVVLIPEYATARQLARLLCARAVLKSDAGDFAGAFKDISTTARIARHMSEDPIIIAFLVHTAVDAIADRALRMIVLSHPDSLECVELARKASADIDRSPDLLHALGGELVIDRVSVDMVRKDPQSRVRRIGPFRVVARAATVADYCDSNEVHLIRYWREAVQLIQASRGQLMQSYSPLKAMANDADRRNKEPGYDLVSVLIPDVSQVVLKQTGIEMRRRLRQIMFDLIAFRQRNKSWPGALEELGKAVPIDVFVNRPVIYRRTKDGFLLYSVGDNFKDDGGREHEPGTNKGMLDLVVQYPMK